MTKILLVDDYKELHESIKLIINPIYEVLSAFNGKEALEKLVENPDVKVIFTDYNMPIMDGWEFYQELKKNPEYEEFSKIPIIAIGDFFPKQKKDFNDSIEKSIRCSEMEKIIKKYSK